MKRIMLEFEDVWDDEGNLSLLKFHQVLETNHRNNLHVIFPQKVYRFDKTDIKGAYFHLKDCHDITLDGSGSLFVFSKVGHYFLVEDCQGIVIQHIELDWLWKGQPLASIGIVKDVRLDGGYVDMYFPQYEQVDHQMNIKMVGPLNPYTFSPGTPDGVEFRPFVNPYIPDEMRQGYPELMNQIRELEDRFGKIEKIADQILRFHMKDPVWTRQRMKTGQAYQFRHYEYDTVGVMVTRSKEFHFMDITMYSCPGSGFVFKNDVSKFSMKKCAIKMKPGTFRTITTTADGLHIANTQGEFRIEDCEFSYAGDDCINFHDNTVRGLLREKANSFILKLNRESLPIFAGDYLEFRAPDLSPREWVDQVHQIEYDDDTNECRIEMMHSLPEQVSSQDIIWNRRYHTGQFNIQRNYFHDNRARGLLLHGSNGCVEGNRFERIQSSAIQIETGAEIRWAEGMGVEHVRIQSNTFVDCNLNGWNMAVLYMGVYLPGGRTDYPVFRHIDIINNSFIGSPRQAVFISSADKVKVQGNAIINCMQRDLDEPSYGSSQEEQPIYGERYEGHIQAMNCKDVEIVHLF